MLGLVGVCFAAVYIRRFGPRGLALGMIGWMSYFFALFFHAPLQALPAMLASVVAGLAVAYVVRFWIVPNDGAKSVRRGLAVLPGAIATALEALASALRAPGWGSRRGTGERQGRAGAAAGAGPDAERHPGIFQAASGSWCPV